VIDADELDDLRLPTRAPDATECYILDAIALALHRDQGDVFELVDGSAATAAKTPSRATPRMPLPSGDGNGDTASTHSTRAGRPRHGSRQGPRA